MEAVRRQKARQAAARLAVGSAWQDRRNLLFTDAVGRPVAPGQVSKAFRVAADRLGLTDVRFHDLRHTAATLMLRAGVPLKVVSEALGHVSIVVTADIYAHVTPDMQRDAADAMDRALAGRRDVTTKTPKQRRARLRARDAALARAQTSNCLHAEDAARTGHWTKVRGLEKATDYASNPESVTGFATRHNRERAALWTSLPRCGALSAQRIGVSRGYRRIGKSPSRSVDGCDPRSYSVPARTNSRTPDRPRRAIRKQSRRCKTSRQRYAAWSTRSVPN